MPAAVDKSRGTAVLDALPAVILLTGAEERPPACAGRRALSLMRMGAGLEAGQTPGASCAGSPESHPGLANVWQGWPCACPTMRARGTSGVWPTSGGP
jgi:hypothetical protein